MKKDKLWVRVVIYAILCVFMIVSIYPIIRVLSISLRPGDRLLSTSLAIIPPNATLDSFVELFTRRPFLKWMRNSFIVSTAVTILGLTLASTAGYVISRFRFIGRKSALLGILTTQMFPATMLLLPMYIILSYLNLINSYIGLMVVYVSTALPFCIWTMKGYYDTIPRSLEEAAMIDGCNQFSAFYRAVLPLAAPALVITGLFSFMSSWSEYLVAAQILQDPEMYTLPLGLKQFQQNMSTEWGLYAAGALVVAIPVIVLFMIANRWLVSGLTLGSVKE
ncbi:sugar ABC transporter permease [bacterium]|nr:sugar ABC transporter permease [bacterium]MBU1652036.1 sugar ABC transporter permease [bacterium]MBU1880752.1 sugar ABC transporter permease [bacterium]